MPGSTGTSGLARWLITGLLSGAVALLVFHQGAVALLYAIGLSADPAYSLEPTKPWGIPELWSLTAWGGAWGVLLAVTLQRLEGLSLIVAATLFGMLLPTIVGWFVIATLLGLPVAEGGDPQAMVTAVVSNAVWGLAAGVGLALLGRARATHQAH
jgi:hypothetical protein